jgi:hypothetical protein
MLTS